MVQFLMSLEQLEEISNLMRGGDWALAHGDFGTLATVADQLSSHVGAPLQHALREIASLTQRDLDGAARQWMTARSTLHSYLCDRAEGATATC